MYLYYLYSESSKEKIKEETACTQLLKQAESSTKFQKVKQFT